MKHKYQIWAQDRKICWKCGIKGTCVTFRLGGPEKKKFSICHNCLIGDFLQSEVVQGKENDEPANTIPSPVLAGTKEQEAETGETDGRDRVENVPDVSPVGVPGPDTEPDGQ